jgi:hypothetical protein
MAILNGIFSFITFHLHTFRIKLPTTTIGTLYSHTIVDIYSCYWCCTMILYIFYWYWHTFIIYPLADFIFLNNWYTLTVWYCSWTSYFIKIIYLLTYHIYLIPSTSFWGVLNTSFFIKKLLISFKTFSNKLSYNCTIRIFILTWFILYWLT